MISLPFFNVFLLIDKQSYFLQQILNIFKNMKIKYKFKISRIGNIKRNSIDSKINGTCFIVNYNERALGSCFSSCVKILMEEVSLESRTIQAAIIWFSLRVCQICWSSSPVSNEGRFFGRMVQITCIKAFLFTFQPISSFWDKISWFSLSLVKCWFFFMLYGSSRQGRNWGDCQCFSLKIEEIWSRDGK